MDGEKLTVVSIIVTVIGIIVSVIVLFSSSPSQEDGPKEADSQDQISSSPKKNGEGIESNSKPASNVQPSNGGAALPSSKTPMADFLKEISAGSVSSWRTTKPVDDVFLSEDGKVAITVHRADETMIVWDVDRKREKSRLEKHKHHNEYPQVIISPNNAYALSLSRDSVMLWDLHSGEELCYLKEISVPASDAFRTRFNREHEKYGTFCCATFTPDNKKVVVAAEHPVYSLKEVVCEMDLKGNILRYKRHGEDDLFHVDTSSSMQFTSNGRRLLIHGDGGYSKKCPHLKLFEFSTWHDWQRFEVYGNDNGRLTRMSPDGQWVLTNYGGYQGLANLWDVQTGKVIVKAGFRGGYDSVEGWYSIAAMGFFPSNQPVMLRVDGLRGYCEIRYVKTDQKIGSLRFEGSIGSFSFAPRARQVLFSLSPGVSPGRRLVLWKLPNK